LKNNIRNLDKGIRKYVEILRAEGVETYESCEGGISHAYPEPTIRFHGNCAEGFRVLSVALNHHLPIFALRRVWDIQDMQPVGPTWEIVFIKPKG
jgi:hypothetical protein